MAGMDFNPGHRGVKRVHNLTTAPSLLAPQVKVNLFFVQFFKEMSANQDVEVDKVIQVLDTRELALENSKPQRLSKLKYSTVLLGKNMLSRGLLFRIEYRPVDFLI